MSYKEEIQASLSINTKAAEIALARFVVNAKGAINSIKGTAGASQYILNQQASRIIGQQIRSTGPMGTPAALALGASTLYGHAGKLMSSGGSLDSSSAAIYSALRSHAAGLVKQRQALLAQTATARISATSGLSLGAMQRSVGAHPGIIGGAVSGGGGGLGGIGSGLLSFGGGMGRGMMGLGGAGALGGLLGKLGPIGMVGSALGGSLMGGVRAVGGLGLGAVKMGFSAISTAASGLWGVLKGILTFPATLLQGLTAVRHFFWNLTFMAGLAGGAMYAMVKTLEPAGKMQRWGTMFAMLGGKGNTAAERTIAGGAYSKETTTYIKTLAQTMGFTVEEMMDAGVLMQTFGMFSKEGFKVAAEAAWAFHKPLEQVIRALGMVKAGAGGQAMRMLRPFGVDYDKLKREGIKISRGRKILTSPADTVAAVFRIMQREIGGMSDILAHSFEVGLKNIPDKVFNALATGFEHLIPYATYVVNLISENILGIGKRLANYNWAPVGLNIAAALKTASDAVMGPGSAMDKLKAGGSMGWAATKEIGAAIGQTFLAAIDHSETIAKHIINAVKFLGPPLETLFGKLAEVFGGRFAYIVDSMMIRIGENAGKLGLGIAATGAVLGGETGRNLGILGGVVAAVGPRLSDIGKTNAANRLNASGLGGLFLDKDEAWQTLMGNPKLRRQVYGGSVQWSDMGKPPTPEATAALKNDVTSIWSKAGANLGDIFEPVSRQFAENKSQIAEQIRTMKSVEQRLADIAAEIGLGNDAQRATAVSTAAMADLLGGE